MVTMVADAAHVLVPMLLHALVKMYMVNMHDLLNLHSYLFKYRTV